jgi:hypothetical protein
MKIKVKCLNCECDFDIEFKRRNQKFCNQNCYFEYNQKNKIMGRKKDESIREIRLCCLCGKDFEVKKSQPNKLCSDKCRKEWNSIKENKINRINASKEKFLEKYGVDSLFKTDEFKENYKQIMLKKHGVDHPMKMKKTVETLQNTVREKHILNLLPKLQNNNLILLDEYTRNKTGNTSKEYNFKCLICNNIFTSTVLGSGKTPICRKCFPMIKNSKLEEIIRDFLNNNEIKHLDNNRSLLGNKEIDLFIESENLGIEVNGNYFHSEISGNKDKKYHINKSKCAFEKNIKLIHIFEDEILFKKEIVISRLSNLLNLNNNKIFARKCTIKEVNKKESKNFLNDNHIQGDSIDKIRIGLYYNNDLVSLMTFSHLRKVLGSSSIDGHYELSRFCNKMNLNVVGGFSKLLKYFIKYYNPIRIISYADIRWSGLNIKETVYFKNGFNHLNNTPPNYWYIKVGDCSNRYHRFTFRKDILLKEGYDVKLTEWEIMQQKGYDRIWDCGNMKFEMILS